MNIKIAKKSGFCFGVKEAIKKGNEAVQRQGEIYSLGPLIHNPQEVERLQRKGIQVIDDISDWKEGSILIRAHGVPPRIYEIAQDKNISIIDCTCPFVKKVQKIANDFSKKDFLILILGEKTHPEVQGILGWSFNNGFVFENIEELKELEKQNNFRGKKICFVSQTTQNTLKYEMIEDYLSARYDDVVSFNTICLATKDRQESAVELAKKVDLMIVIGGLNSANTKKLALLCKETKTPTKHIETYKDLEKEWFFNVKDAGITAGASTPDWIIEEVVEKMEELNKEKDLEQKEEVDFVEEMQEVKEVESGDIVPGKVVQINENGVLVDIGAKTEGLIPLNELSFGKVNDPNDFVAIGDEVKVSVLRGETEEGNKILSKRRADQILSVDILQKAFDDKETIEAKVTEIVKGGLLVDVGVRGFMPASLLERGYVEDLSQYIGKKLKMRVIEFDPEEKKAVLSRKVILDEEYEVLKEETLKELEKGQTRKGIVRRITSFGAFIDLGGVDGLLHVSEMALGRVENPKDVVSEGQELEVYILNVDKEGEKVSLSLKALLPDPWECALDKYPEGSTINGKVVRIAPFGAFVELEPGLDGLVHISQLAWERVGKPEDIVSVGDEIKAKVLELDLENKRLSLSMKEAMSQPAEPKNEAVVEVEDGPSGCTIGDAIDANELKKKLTE